MADKLEARKLPRRAACYKLGHRGQTLEGEVPLAELPRVCEILGESAREVSLRPVLKFALDEEGHIVVEGNFEASVELVCQRCLEPMTYPVEASFHCAFVASDAVAKRLPAHLEPVMLEPGSSYTDLYNLLEDELLLDLPIAALHDSCGAVREVPGTECSGASSEVDPAGESTGNAVTRPFQVLSDLLK